MKRILARTQKVVHDPDGMILGRKASNPMRHIQKVGLVLGQVLDVKMVGFGLDAAWG